MPTDKPNVILLLSDEHCGFAMSHVGDPNVRTPSMDRPAAEGVSFERPNTTGRVSRIGLASRRCAH